jgi:sulfite exporter TauE/SafE
MIYGTAFALGIFSSLHCIGMCGPIALATPVIRKNFFTELVSRLLYNGGRALAYISIGCIAGAVGSIFYMGGIQQWVSIISGAIILLWVMVPTTNPENWKVINRLPVISSIRNKMGRLFKTKSYGAIFLIGVLNGFLPCGMVYMAVIGALTASTLAEGGLYMLFFALGTWPLMFILTSAWQMAGQQFRIKTRKLLPYMVGIIGLMLIVRGAGLGIPYLSPVLKPAAATMATCH